MRWGNRDVGNARGTRTSRNALIPALSSHANPRAEVERERVRPILVPQSALPAHSFLTNHQKYVTIWSHMKDDDPIPGVLDVTQSKQEPMRIKLTSVSVDDQEKPLRCSTDVLGFVTFEAFDQ